MIEVVGVRINNVGRIIFFDANGFDLIGGDWVIVDTERGIDSARVVMPPRFISKNDIKEQSLRRVSRVCNSEDEKAMQENRKKEKEAFEVCCEKIASRELSMKLVYVEFAFDTTKITFYFTAPKRIDFRELVKDLASAYKTRIELRQIGARDEAKLFGGLGPCGRAMCCTSFLDRFASVSIRMVKGQNLALNPQKISGTCGRLMCCIAYEQEEETDRLPKIGDTIPYGDEMVKVIKINDDRNTVSVELPSGKREEIPLEEL